MKMIFLLVLFGLATCSQIKIVPYTPEVMETFNITEYSFCVYDSGSEVLRIDSSGKIFIRDSSRAINALIKSLFLVRKDKDKIYWQNDSLKRELNRLLNGRYEFL